MISDSNEKDTQPSQPSQPQPEPVVLPQTPYNPNWDRIEKGQVPDSEKAVPLRPSRSDD